MGQALSSYESLYQKLSQEYIDSGNTNKILIQVGSATCEKAAGADQVRQEFTKLIQASGRDDILLKQTGCTGRCAREPIVGVFIPGQIPIKYEQVTVEKVEKIFQHHVLGGEPLAARCCRLGKTDALHLAFRRVQVVRDAGDQRSKVQPTPIQRKPDPCTTAAVSA